MKQLTQRLKDGMMEILEVPAPGLGKKQVLIKNHYSVISLGTEGKTVSDARKGYFAKAKSRQKEVKQVIEMIKTEGLINTYDLVMNKLDAPSSLGYSCAGEVIAVGENISDIIMGDFVACGGINAAHAEIVAVDRNLCVKVPKFIDLRHAAFTTIASISIQGIRQADVRLGENCVIIGLGLIGLITVQVLKAAGVKVIGIDLNPNQVKKAKEIGADMAFMYNQSGLVEEIVNITNGHGTDAIIITADTNSTDPIELAGAVARKKAKVVIVGSVPTGFTRLNYFKKELELRMSSSYGPGRYDSIYEEKGIDYPIGYVRFTLNRNMQTFIDLLVAQKIDLESLITHTFDLSNAPIAYDALMKKKDIMIGILIKYDLIKKYTSSIKNINYGVSGIKALNIGFIGAGNFAQSTILPKIKDKCSLIGITTSKGNISSFVAKKYGFNYCAQDAEELFMDETIGSIFIATRHDSHHDYITKALIAGKNVIVEKPLAMNLEELNNIKDIYLKSGKGLMVGFNRRFSQLITRMKRDLSSGQKRSISIKVNAGIIPSDHWVHDPEIGGGRIIGELCHFIDLACFIADSKVKSLQAFMLSKEPITRDTLTLNLEFESGSIANICYFSNGNRKIAKERVEVFSNGTIFIIEDFKTLFIYDGNGTTKIKAKGMDKGHTCQFNTIVESLKYNKSFPITFDEIYHTTLLTFETIKSIIENRTIKLI